LLISVAVINSAMDGKIVAHAKSLPPLIISR